MFLWPFIPALPFVHMQVWIPSQGSPFRRAWNALHAWAGRLSFLIGWAACITGALIYEAE